jgi:DNA-binding NtrC family response regulator
VKEQFTILIADRNPHVRDFLKREMVAEGFRVQLAENGREVLKWVYHHQPLDLVILDLDLPDTDEMFLLKKLQNRIPFVPVVLHTYFEDYASHAEVIHAAAFVEKGGSSVERLKQVVAAILSKTRTARDQMNRFGKSESREPCNDSKQ